MNNPGHHTLSEIISQPEAWSAALSLLEDQSPFLRNFFRRGKFKEILFTGCGSTYYLSLAAAALAQELLGLPARGLPASELWLYPASAYKPDHRTLLVAVSRSGETTETLRACEAFRSSMSRGAILTLSCYPGRPLTQLGDINLVFPSAMEESIAQTRAFTTLYLVASVLATRWANRDELLPYYASLPSILGDLLVNYSGMVKQIGEDSILERFYFLGSGIRYGLACELSLKMKEMSLSHSEPFHFMEFRHGPQSMVNSQTIMVCLLGKHNRSQEADVLVEMHRFGARILALSPIATGTTQASPTAPLLPEALDHLIRLPESLPEQACGPLYLPLVQLMAYHHALHNGQNPDQPHHLSDVVRLKDIPR